MMSHVQALLNIRTVVSYVGEKHTSEQYSAALAKPQKMS